MPWEAALGTTASSALTCQLYGNRRSSPSMPHSTALCEREVCSTKISSISRLAETSA